MQITRTTYPGWPEYPVYRVTNSGDYQEITDWMFKNKVEYFDLSTGSSGYIFQVRDNHWWFALKWSS